MADVTARDAEGEEIGRAWAEDDIAFGRLVKTDEELRMMLEEEVDSGESSGWTQQACISAYRSVIAQRGYSKR
jgi:hypothetical protein